MRLLTRDQQVLQAVALFSQLSSEQIRRALFYENKSATPCDRALKRLLEQRLLARVERRTVGGDKGGSGQYVYQLGPAGWRLSEAEGSYWQARAVNYHTLAVAEVWVELGESELDIIRLETEPDCHRKIEHITLQPDLYLEAAINGRTGRFWFEVDLGTERPRQLRDKMNRYWEGYKRSSGVYPMVVWVTPDKARLRALKKLVLEEPADSHELYRFAVLGDVVNGLLS